MSAVPANVVRIRRGAVLGGSSLMSSAWRATGVILPVTSASVTVMWSVLNAWADAAGKLVTSNVATSSAQPIKPSSAGRDPMSIARTGFTGCALQLGFGLWDLGLGFSEE